MIKKKSILPMLLGVLMCFSPTVAHAAPKDIATVTYDKDLSLVTIVPNQEGVTTFSYKIDGAYPTYQYDKVMYFDETGKLVDTKEGMKGKPIFSEDSSTWIDVSKDKVSLPPDSEYYEILRSEEVDVIVPYTEDNPDHIFYIPLDNHDSKVEIIVANGDNTQTIELDSKIKKNPMKAEVKSVSKKESEEVVEISGKNISHVVFDGTEYKAKDNKVKLTFTSNGVKDFVVYGVDDDDYDVLSYEVTDLKGELTKEEFDKEFTQISDAKVDTKAPVITVDKLPKEKQAEPLKFKVYTDEKCNISCDGESVTGTEMEITVDSNCKLIVTAVDMSGNFSEKIIDIDCFAEQSKEYVLDRDNFWKDTGDNLDSSNDTGVSNGADEEMTSLPKTGDTIPAIAFSVAALFIATGIILVRRKKA